MQKVMQRTFAALLPIFALVPIGCASDAAAPEAPRADEPTARAILDAYVQTTGADRLVAETSSLRMLGHIQLASMGLEGPVEVLQAKPSFLLMRYSMGAAGETVVGYDGEVGWMSNPMLGTNVLEGAELVQMRWEADYAARLMRPEDYESIELVGREEIEGRECFKVLTVHAGDPELAGEAIALRTRTLWFDAETGLQTAMLQTQSGLQGSMDVTTTYETYEPFGDYLIPTRWRQETMGMEVVITIDEVELDAVDPASFALPDAVRNQLDG